MLASDQVPRKGRGGTINGDLVVISKPDCSKCYPHFSSPSFRYASSLLSPSLSLVPSGAGAVIRLIGGLTLLLLPEGKGRETDSSRPFGLSLSLTSLLWTLVQPRPLFFAPSVNLSVLSVHQTHSQTFLPSPYFPGITTGVVREVGGHSLACT